MFPWALVVTWLVLEAWPGVGAVDAAGPLVVKYAKKQPAKVTVKVRSTTPRPETGNPQDAIQPDDSTSIILGNIKPEPPPAIDKRVHLANVEAMKRRVASFYVSHNRAATYDPLSLCDRLDWISFMTTQLIKNPKLKIKLNKLLEEGKLGEKRNKGMCGAFFGL
ncbi:erythrocyte membrane associated protein, putative [Babesia caballi]|uniref:Erythrocyte membrane associated protein, putative n=1 Tax=Babesia caballi TaxID=5871 RepID=A0AAV4LLH2_BABCB|nr:erythrocyte membrane associated protein, putative [Babesia caballi]